VLNVYNLSKADFYNWNKVRVRYCDGSSFTGDKEEVDPVSEPVLHPFFIFIAAADITLGPLFPEVLFNIAIWTEDKSTLQRCEDMASSSGRPARERDEQS
jgi:hypothetical protein